VWDLLEQLAPFFLLLYGVRLLTIAQEKDRTGGSLHYPLALGHGLEYNDFLSLFEVGRQQRRRRG
jgi:hypothetical protein